MIPELSPTQNSRALREKITLPFGHNWLSLKDWYDKKLPNGSKIFSCGAWSAYSGKWTNKIAVICAPVYPEISSGYKLVMDGEKIESGYEKDSYILRNACVFRRKKCRI